MTRSTPMTNSSALASPRITSASGVDAAVVQADHAEYRTLGPADLPGIAAFIDGRRVSSPEAWGE